MNVAVDTTTENIDRTVTGLKDGMAHATAGIQQAQTAIQDGMQKMIKGTEEMVSFSQGNIEALARSSQILAAGLQDLSQTVAASAKTSLEEMVGTYKAISSVKSFKDLFDLQSSLMRSAMERAVAQTGQLTETAIKLSERAFDPISARITIATDKLSRIS